MLNELVARGQGALDRLLELLRRADRRRGEGRARRRASTASSRSRTSTRSSSARPRRTSCPRASGSGIGFLPYFPLASGLLTGKYRRGEKPTEGRLAGREIARRRAGTASRRSQRYARRRAASRSSTSRSAGCSRSPRSRPSSPGATKPEQVHANVAAGAWEPSRRGRGGAAGAPLIFDATPGDAAELRAMFREYAAFDRRGVLGQGLRGRARRAAGLLPTRSSSRATTPVSSSARPRSSITPTAPRS